MSKITSKYRIHLICISLTVLTFIAFQPVLHNKFISFDDNDYILDNSHITGGLKPANIIWALTNIHANNYHPVTSLSHMLDCALYGTNPAGHHFTNLLFHIANTLLLFSVLSRMTGKVWASAFVVALFALHPLHVESVAWASERKDTLSTFFWLLTMLAYVRYVRRPVLGRYLLILILFLLGLLSKPMVVTLPLVLLLLDYWPLGRPFNKRLIIEKIPFFVLSAVVGIITLAVQSKVGIVKSVSNYPLSWRVENAVVSYVIYIVRMFWPSRLAVFYPHPKGNIPFWQVTGSLLVLVIITLLALRQSRRRPYMIAGWLWFLITLAPVIGVFQVGLQGRADRYTYIPYIGLFIMLVWSVFSLLSGLRYRVVIFSVLAGLLIPQLAVRTYIQTLYWNNDLFLYTHAIEVVENNDWAHNHLGRAYALQKEFKEAVRNFELALEIDPENDLVYHALAKTLLDKGDIDKAAELYRKLLPKVTEDFASASQSRYPFLKELYISANINFAKALVQQGSLTEAAGYFKEALRVAPDAETAKKGLEEIEKKLNSH